MTVAFSRQWFSLYDTQSRVWVYFARFKDHYQKADFLKQLSINQTFNIFLVFLFQHKFKILLTKEEKNELLRSKPDNNGKYHLFSCGSGIFKVVLIRKREKSPFKHDCCTVSSEMPQIYLPMHSVPDWPVPVAFVKLTPNHI